MNTFLSECWPRAVVAKFALTVKQFIPTFFACVDARTEVLLVNLSLSPGAERHIGSVTNATCIVRVTAMFPPLLVLVSSRSSPRSRYCTCQLATYQLGLFIIRLLLGLLLILN